MVWLDYYNLLKKYDGDISKASRDELVDVMIKNNADPDTALQEARRMYNQEHETLI